MEEPTKEELEYMQSEEYKNFVRERDSNQLCFDAWKESIDYAKHWESLVFESAKNYFTVIAFAIAGAGAAVAWSSIDRDIQKYVVLSFLILSLILSVAALFTIRSQKRYLSGFYDRRKEIERSFPNLMLRKNVARGGDTLFLLQASFTSAAVVALILSLFILFHNPPRLDGAKLNGADLSTVKGLTQYDLEGACGNKETKLPQGLKVKLCE